MRNFTIPDNTDAQLRAVAMKEAVLHNFPLPAGVSAFISLADPMDLIWTINDMGPLAKVTWSIYNIPRLYSFDIAVTEHGNRTRDIYHAQIEEQYFLAIKEDYEKRYTEAKAALRDS